MQNICKLFVVAENRLLREALVRLLNKKRENRVVGSGDYSPCVHDEIIAASPDIILVDSSGLTFCDGTFIRDLQLAMRDLRVVMVDMESDETTFLEAVRAGVVGYILKDTSAAEVGATIRAVRDGQAVCPPSLSLFFFRRIAWQDSVVQRVCRGTEIGLSRREQQMVELLGERLTNKEIAARLNLSEQTIKNHVHHILRKVGVSGRSAIIDLCENQAAREQPHPHGPGKREIATVASVSVPLAPRRGMRMHGA